MAARFDWHLVEWMRSLKVSQAELCRRTGYPKAKLSDLVTGKQRYNRDIINEMAHALHIRPPELLMPPEDAMAIRRVRENAAKIATVRLEGDESAKPEGEQAVNE